MVGISPTLFEHDHQEATYTNCGCQLLSCLKGHRWQHQPSPYTTKLTWPNKANYKFAIYYFNSCRNMLLFTDTHEQFIYILFMHVPNL